MSDDTWRADPVVHVAVKDVQVRAAQSGEGDGDAYLPRARLRLRRCAHFEGAVPDVNGLLHDRVSCRLSSRGGVDGARIAGHDLLDFLGSAAMQGIEHCLTPLLVRRHSGEYRPVTGEQAPLRAEYVERVLEVGPNQADGPRAPGSLGGESG